MDAFETVRSPCLKACANAFFANMLRTTAFAMMPAEIAFQVRRDTLFMSNAKFRAAGQTESTLDSLIDDNLTAEVFSEMATQMQQFVSLGRIEANRIRGELGLTFIEVLARTNAGMADSMDAMLSSVVADSWTAFEVFVGDLWAAGVDNGPPIIAGRLIDASGQFKNPKEEHGFKKAHEMGNVTATSHPGSYLRKAGKVSLTRLPDMKLYYKIAFEKQVSDLFTTVSEGYVQALSAFRNVLVHSAGYADKNFTLQVAPFAEFRGINEGTLLELNGTLVQRLRTAAAEVALALLKQVDDLVSRPA